MPYNRYKVKCYGSCLVAPYMVLAGMVDSDVTIYNLVPRGRDPFGQHGDRDLWPGPIPEVRDSRTSRHCAHAQSQV